MVVEGVSEGGATEVTKSFLLSTEIINDSERREMLTVIVAGVIKKMNVTCTYMLEFTYDDLEEIVY